MAAVANHSVGGVGVGGLGCPPIRVARVHFCGSCNKAMVFIHIYHFCLLGFILFLYFNTLFMFIFYIYSSISFVVIYCWVTINLFVRFCQ